MDQIKGQMTLFDYLSKLQTQVSSFDPLYEFAKRGTGFCGGKKRVLAFFAEKADKKERARFLKKEYGCGGFGSPRGDRNKYQLAMGDWATPMAKGKIRLSWYVPGKDDEEEEVFSYEQLHDKIVECIGNNEY